MEATQTNSKLNILLFKKKSYVLVKTSKVEEMLPKVNRFIKALVRISSSKIKSLFVPVNSVSLFDKTHKPANYYKTGKYSVILLYVILVKTITSYKCNKLNTCIWQKLVLIWSLCDVHVFMATTRTHTLSVKNEEPVKTHLLCTCHTFVHEDTGNKEQHIWVKP